MSKHEKEILDEKQENVSQDEQTDVEPDDTPDSDMAKEVERLTKELTDQKEKFLRVAAEYDNYRKRTQQDKVMVYNNAISDAVEKFLPLADNFDLALNSVASSENEEYTKGIQMLQKQFKDILTNLNVEEFGEIGDAFDPNVHNAVAHVEDESQDENVIVEVFRKGYSIQDRVIRHAMVKVAN